jgi:hypothetical protein
MFVLTEDSTLVCSHRSGRARVAPSQGLVRVEGRRLLVEPDPDGCAIAGCANIGATIRPCLRTLTPQAGYSTFVRVDGRPFCLETVTGGTDGTPPGAASYLVAQVGQELVAEKP